MNRETCYILFQLNVLHKSVFIDDFSVAEDVLKSLLILV